MQPGHGLTRATPARIRRASAYAAGAAVVGAMLAASPAAAEVPAGGLLLSYDFSETSGTVVHDASGTGNDGSVVGGEAWRDGFMEFTGENHVALPDDLLAGREAATIVAETTPEALAGAQFLWNIGGSGDDGEGQMFIQPVDPRLTISSTNWSDEQTARADRTLVEGASQSVAATIARNADGSASTLRLFVDGELWAENTGSVTHLDDLATHTMNLLGASAYSGDHPYEGRMSTFRVYGVALEQPALQQISDADAPEAAAEAVRAIDLGSANEQDLSAIETDIVLPTAGSVTWSGEPAGVIAPDGAVTQPQTTTDVTLTATSDVRGETATRTFEVTVAAAPTDVEQARRDLDAIRIPNADDLRSSISLPETGARYGSELIWTSDAPGVIDVDGSDGVAPGLVTRPADGDRTVVLTAAARAGDATATREIEVVVRAAYEMPETTDYLFAHFTGTEGAESDEQIYFATSRDATTFTDTRPDGDPALSVDRTQGDGGVRDPFLVRSPEGDRFYLIATDLSIYHRGGWGNADATNSGSTRMAVWESTDLVNWSEPRFPDIAGLIPDAGMMWAPEAIWDEASQQYYVFWATRSEAQNEIGDPVNMYIATTRDFVTFSDPVKWIDREHSIIDTTVFQVGDWFYRASGDGQITIEKSKAIASPTVSALPRETGSEDEWVLVGTLQSIMDGTNESCATGTNYSGGCLEGPEFFQYNDDDAGADEALYGLMADQYGAGLGYLPFRTGDIGSTSADDWSKATDVDYGALKKRHGTILPITSEEYDRVMRHYAGVGDSPDDGYGYLMAHFVEDPDGYAEKIYFDLSRGDDPTKWDRLNGGEAILASDLGSTGVRDPYLVRNPNTGTYYLMATDLRVFGCQPYETGGYSYDCADHDTWWHGANLSRELVFWESDDLVNWSDPWTLTVAQPDQGMAWAPEATWDPVSERFVMYWSSKTYPTTRFPNQDAAEPGAYAKVHYGFTTDFRTDYAYGGVMFDATKHGVVRPLARAEYDRLREADAAPPVSVEASTRCIAGSAYVVARSTNEGTASADIEVTTAFGSRVFEAVDPGARVSVSFNARQASVDAGEVRADSGSLVDARAVYDVISCG